MKGKIIISVGILLLFVAPNLLAENQKKEISVDEAMKLYCVTWINPAYNEIPRNFAIRIMNKDGTFEFYDNETSESPTWEGEFEIEKSWIDKEGNVWLNVILDGGWWKQYNLEKICDNGNTLEQANDWHAYPTVDPETWPYIIMHKK